MAGAVNVQSKKIRLQTHLHDVTVQFFKHARPKPNSLPPIYLQLSCGSTSLASCRVSLKESPSGSGTYVAWWKREVLSVEIAMQRLMVSDSDKFQTKEVKFFLKICSKGRVEGEHRVLASSTLDVSSLKLGSLDYATETSERKQLLFQFGKKATNAIDAIRLVATFQCESVEEIEGDPSSHPGPSSTQHDSAAPQPTLPRSKVSSPWLPKISLPKSQPLKGSISTTSSGSEDESTSVSSRKHLLAPPGGSRPSAHMKKKAKGLFLIQRSKQYSVRRKSSKHHHLKKDKRQSGLPSSHHSDAMQPSISSLVTFSSNGHGEFAKTIVKKAAVSSATQDVQSVHMKQTGSEDYTTQGISAEGKGIAPIHQNEDSTTACQMHKAPANANTVCSRDVTSDISTDSSNTDSVSEGLPAPKFKYGVAVLPPIPSPQPLPEHIAKSPPLVVVQQPADVKGKQKRKAAAAAELISPRNSPPVQLTSSDDSSSYNLEPLHEEEAEHTSDTPSGEKLTTRRGSSEGKPPLPYSYPRKFSDPPQPPPHLVDQFRSRSHSTNVFQVKRPAMGSPRSRMSPPLGSPSPPQPRQLKKSGSTPLLLMHGQVPGRRFRSTTNLQDTFHVVTEKDRVSSIADLIRPVRRLENKADIPQAQPDNVASLGVVKVRVTGVNRGQADDKHAQLPLTQLAVDPEKTIPSSQEAQQAKEGLYCALSINGGNTRAETSVKPITPRRPVIWDEPEEVIFYAKQSQQVMIMCRKKVLQKYSNATPPVGKSPSEDACIGAAILPLSTLHVSPPGDNTRSPLNISYLLSKATIAPKSLQLQPKGSLLLQASFYGLSPRVRTICKGSVRVHHLTDIDCSPTHELCCSTRLDDDIKGCTSVLGIEDYSGEAWMEEPIEFNANGNFDYGIHIWAYSPDETEYWCGGCTVPLAMVLPEGARREARAGSLYFLTEPTQRTITLPVEPQGELSLSFTLEPLSKKELEAMGLNSDGDTAIAPLPDDTVHSPLDEETENVPGLPLLSLSHMNPKRATLRKSRTVTSDMRERTFAVSIRKSYVEKSMPLEQENTDLKKEVEYLREELRKTKASLAEKEFFYEKVLLELRCAQEELAASNKKESSKSTGVTQKLKRYITT